MSLRFSYALLQTLLTVTFSLATDNVDYSDLETMGVSCFPRDSCNSENSLQTLNRTFWNTNCECDPLCHLYKDCCVDVSVNPYRPRALRGKKFSCMPLNPPYEGIYAVNKCQRRWQGSREVRRKCEILEDFSDPLVASPVTDTINNITYKNLFCAECNQADVERLVSWPVNIQCESLSDLNSTHRNITEDYFMQNMIYESQIKKWGIYYWNALAPRGQQETFHFCDLSFPLPVYLRTHVRLCRPNITSTCEQTWSRDVIRQKCEAYMATVYHNSIGYKNPHCALCNNVNMTYIDCAVGIVPRNKPAISFTLLLDVNMSDGNTVGMTTDRRECPENQKWDPFTKKCRKLVCALPGYEMVDGRCVRQT